MEWQNQNSSYRGKFRLDFDQGKGHLVRVSEEFEFSGFYLIPLILVVPCVAVYVSLSKLGNANISRAC